MPSTYYNFNRILSYNCVFNFIPGGRGIGKTFGAKKLAINDALKNGSEFIYLRRYAEDLDEASALFFDDIAHLWPKLEFQTTLRYASYTKKLIRDVDETEAAFDKRLKERQWTKIGHFIPLSKAQRFKSTPFPRVKWIINDEFILEKGAIRYLPNEADILMNFYSSVDRYADNVRVLCLANAVSINNPYFLKWKIRPSVNNEIQKLAIDDTGSAFIACDFPDSKQFQSEVYQTRFGKFIQGTDYANYAVGNIFVDNGENLIKGKDSTAEYVFTLETESSMFSVWLIRKPGAETEYYMQARQPKIMTIMTTVANKMDTDRVYIADNDKILKILRAAYSKAICWFDSPETRNAFIEVFVR